MSLVFEKVVQPLAAEEKWIIGIAGSFLRLSECQWPVTVVIIKENRIVGEMRNMQAGDYVQEVEFDAVWVVNGTVGQSVELQIAAGGAGSSRVMGEVSVINGELNRVKAGGVFIGAPWVGASPGNLGHIQLFNPVGSGKNLIFSKLSAYAPAGVAFPVSILSHGVALATLFGKGANKKIGGAQSVAEFRTATSAAAVGSMMAAFAIEQVGKSVDFNFSEPIIVPPGYGLNFASGVANQTFSTSVQWFEESI